MSLILLVSLHPSLSSIVPILLVSLPHRHVMLPLSFLARFIPIPRVPLPHPPWVNVPILLVSVHPPLSSHCLHSSCPITTSVTSQCPYPSRSVLLPSFVFHSPIPFLSLSRFSSSHYTYPSRSITPSPSCHCPQSAESIRTIPRVPLAPSLSWFPCFHSALSITNSRSIPLSTIPSSHLSAFSLFVPLPSCVTSHRPYNSRSVLPPPFASHHPHPPRPIVPISHILLSLFCSFRNTYPSCPITPSPPSHCPCSACPIASILSFLPPLLVFAPETQTYTRLSLRQVSFK